MRARGWTLFLGLFLAAAVASTVRAQQPATGTLVPSSPPRAIAAKPAAPAIAPPTKLEPLKPKPAAVSKPAPKEPKPIPLTVRAGAHGDFGRLVFETSTAEPPVGITVTSDESNVIIRFDRPVDVPEDDIARRLDKYLIDLTFSPDHRSLSGTMRQAGEIKQSSFEPGSLVIDFVPKAHKPEAPEPEAHKPEAAPPAPKTAAAKLVAKPAPKRPPLPSRLIVSKRGAIDRLTVDLPRAVTAGLTEADNRAHVTLSRPIGLNVARVNASLPAYLRPFDLDPDGGTFGFALPPGRHAQLHREGSHLVAEIGAPVPAPAAKPAAPVAPAAPPAVASAPSAAAPIPSPAPVPVKAPSAMLPAQPAEASLPPVQSLNGVIGRAGNLGLLWTLAGENLSLRFDWAEPASAAIFRHGDALWIVFDRKADIDFSRFMAQNLPVVSGLQMVPTMTGLALRLTVWPSFNPVVHRAGNAWIVDLVSHPMRPVAPVTPSIKHDGTMAALDYNVLNPASPISISDPQTDETLVAVPLPQLGQGVAHTFEMPDLDTLASVQGLAFQPYSDQLQIQTSDTLVEITSPDGLLVSAAADRTTAPAASGGDQKFLFNFADWAGSPDIGEPTSRQELMKRIVGAPDDRRLQARLDLARYYVASAMAPEALGVMAIVQADTPEAFETPSTRALRGAAEELAGHGPEAAADLDDNSLDKEGEIAIWRAAEAAGRHDLKTMAANYSLGKTYLGAYPGELRRRLDLKLADALLDAGDQKSAQGLIDDVQSSDPTKGQADEAKFLSGRMAAAKGDADGAVDLWTQVAASQLMSRARVQASYALALAKLDAGKASIVDTIKTLDRLRYSWRGDAFEITLLRKLAALQIRDGDYRSGFEALRSILTNYPNSDETRGITQEMQQDFADIFIGKEAKAVQPATALAVYDEFKELLPAGPAGDQVNRALTDRLVALGLFDRAGGMLDDDVRHRLTGLDQAKVAARLALVRLLDHKPQAAIDALDLVSATPVPAGLAQQSKEFRARAMFELGQQDAALKLLDGDTSADAGNLRIYIYWQSHNWQAAAAALMADLRQTPANARIDDLTASKIMNLATAMALSNNRAGLDTVRSSYGGAMQKTSYETDFRALVDAGSVDPTSIGTAGGEAPESFLDTYRQRVARNGLSGIN